ncbi:hypothetical protein AB0B31_36465 [Catellatospora citrea]|uniref:hypothetical protein n=1 Tax=Catellatospora citrea TaxID=53366 RepID=UPI0033C53FB1
MRGSTALQFGSWCVSWNLVPQGWQPANSAIDDIQIGHFVMQRSAILNAVRLAGSASSPLVE